MAHESNSLKFSIALSAYVAGLVLANIAGAKVMAIGPWLLSIGTLAYPLTFVLQDYISEKFGRADSKAAVYAALTAMALLIVMSVVVVEIPDPVSPRNQEAFGIVFGLAPRVVIGSLVAFFLGSMIDIDIYFGMSMKGATYFQSKVVSTVISQMFDTGVFVTIAFLGRPGFGPDALFAIVIGQYFLKVAVAIATASVSSLIFKERSR
jgi:uncharacterized integral membrane protein (TIGR00697 family)